MARPSLIEEKRRDLTPVLAAAFAEVGYRRATTAALAKRCGIAENVLYRIWPDKKAMFLAAIDHVFESTVADWDAVLQQHPDDPAPYILAHDAKQRGHSQLHRITFAGLSESDDPEVREALGKMYRRFHRFVADRLREHRTAAGRPDAGPDPALCAWAIIGLGTLTNISMELGLLGRDRRRALMTHVGSFLLDGSPEPG